MSRRLNTSEKTADSKLLSTRITVFTSTHNTPMSKHFACRNGEVVKYSAPPLSKGTGRTVELPNGLPDLPDILAGLSTNQVICLGIPKTPLVGDYPITTTSRGGRGITRTKENYEWPERPIVLLDYDADTKWRTKRLPISQVPNTIRDLIGSRDIGMVVVPSSSSGIYVAGDEPPKEPSSFHIYIQLADAESIPQLREALRIRSWAYGWGYIKLSRSGSKLCRGLVDDSVFDPSRLVFEAPPRIGPGLCQADWAIQTFSGGASI